MAGQQTKLMAAAAVVVFVVTLMTYSSRPSSQEPDSLKSEFSQLKATLDQERRQTRMEQQRLQSEVKTLKQQVEHLSASSAAAPAAAAPAAAAPAAAAAVADFVEDLAVIDPAWKPTRGKAVALPSVRISGAEEAEVAKKRLTGGTQYGGAGDKGHLGGTPHLQPTHIILSTV